MLIHFNIILQSTCGYPKCSLTFRFFNRFPVSPTAACVSGSQEVFLIYAPDKLDEEYSQTVIQLYCLCVYVLVLCHRILHLFTFNSKLIKINNQYIYIYAIIKHKLATVCVERNGLNYL